MSHPENHSHGHSHGRGNPSGVLAYRPTVTPADAGTHPAFSHTAPPSFPPDRGNPSGCSRIPPHRHSHRPRENPSGVLAYRPTVIPASTEIHPAFSHTAPPSFPTDAGIHPAFSHTAPPSFPRTADPSRRSRMPPHRHSHGRGNPSAVLAYRPTVIPADAEIHPAVLAYRPTVIPWRTREILSGVLV